MTMVANWCKKNRSKQSRQSGQSLVEFAFLVPVIIALLMILVQVEEAINTSIVNQKYARQHLHFLFFNNRSYLEHNFLAVGAGPYSGFYAGRSWMGVSDRSTYTVTPEGQIPHAPQRKIGSNKANEDGGLPPEGGGERQNVRVRTLVFSCMAPMGIKVGSPFSENHLEEDTFRGGYKYCYY